MRISKIIGLVLVIQITFMIGLSQPAVASFTQSCTATCPKGTETYTSTCIGNCGQILCFCHNDLPGFTFPCNTCTGGRICCQIAACLFSKCPDSNCPNNCDPCTGCPTVVELISFSAASYNGTVTLEWATDMEIDNVGFNIWRSEEVAGEYIKINDSLIPAEGSGYQYFYIDDAVLKGKTYYYKLEDMDIYGASTFHGPVSTKRSYKGLLPAIQFLLRN